LLPPVHPNQHHAYIYTLGSSLSYVHQELPQEDIEGCAYCLRCSLPKDRFPLSDAIHKVRSSPSALVSI